jgi:hypothetical protein
LAIDLERKFAGLKIARGPVDSCACMGVYGTGGSGKTSLLANVVHSPHGTPALLVDVEGGSSSVNHLTTKGLDIVTPASWQEIMRIRQAVSRDSYYKSIIYDNVSELSVMCMNSINPGPIKQIQQWGQMTALMLELIREARDWARFGERNALFCLWEETEKDELSGVIRKKVNLTPKLAAAFPGIVTMVGRLTVPGRARDGYIRQLSFAPSVDTDSKFRVAPTEAAAKIPLELYLRSDVHFLVDFLATIKDGVPFPVSRYAAPAKQQ